MKAKGKSKNTNHPPLQLLPEEYRYPKGHVPSEQIQAMISNVLYGKKIESKQFLELPAEDIQNYRLCISTGLNVLGDQDRDRLLEQTQHLMAEETLKNIREVEYFRILGIVTNQALDRNRFITHGEIASETGFSRARVKRFFETYASSDVCKNYEETALVSRQAMLAKIFKFGIEGNIKAARLYMELTDPNPPQPKQLRIQNQQNNLVQVNGIVITDEQLNTLPEEASMKLKEILSLINKPPELGTLLPQLSQNG